MGEEGPQQGRVSMKRVSPAAAVGECWLCGRGAWFHRWFGWLLKHDYDPLTEISFAEFERLSKKHGG